MYIIHTYMHAHTHTRMNTLTHPSPTNKHTRAETWPRAHPGYSRARRPDRHVAAPVCPLPLPLPPLPPLPHTPAAVSVVQRELAPPAPPAL